MRTLDNPINDLVGEWLEYQDVRPNSLEVYKKVIRYFITWAVKTKVNIKKPTTADVIGYKNHLRKEGKSSYTIDLYFAVLKSFWKWMDQQGYYKNITVNIRAEQKSKEHKKDYLNTDQISKLLKTIPKDKVLGKRDFCIIQLMSVAGLRCVEVSRLNIEDIKINDEERRFIEILGKGRYEKRPLALPEYTYKNLTEYIENRQDPDYSDPLFVSKNDKRLIPAEISQIVKKRMRACGLDSPKITAHSLRHSAAINALKLQGDIYAVQKMLGHKSIKVTEIYLRALEEEKYLDNIAIHALDKSYKKALESLKTTKNPEDINKKI